MLNAVRLNPKQLLCLVACLAVVSTCLAQAKPSTAGKMSDDELALAVAGSLGPVGVVPVQKGFNASLISSSQHDSANGWSNVITGSVAYRFNRAFSVDASSTVYLYLRSDRKAPDNATLAQTLAATKIYRGVTGDTVMGFHYTAPEIRVAPLGGMTDTLSFLLSAPTGSVTDNVGSGNPTFSVVNHLETGMFLSPYLDLGISNGSRLQDRRVSKSQTTRGELANFAFGLTLELPRTTNLSLEVYELLPLGAQTIVQTTVRKGRTTRTTTTEGLAEDNGFNTAFDIPLQPHLALSGFYSRSLRQHEDTVGFSFTYLLRPPPTAKDR